MTTSTFWKCSRKSCGHVWARTGSQAPVKCPRCQRVRPRPTNAGELGKYLKRWGQRPKAARREAGK